MGYPAPRQGNIPWLVVNTRVGSHCGDLCSVFGDVYIVNCTLCHMVDAQVGSGDISDQFSALPTSFNISHLSAIVNGSGSARNLVLGLDWRQNLREVIIFKFCKRHKVPREGIFHHFFEE